MDAGRSAGDEAARSLAKAAEHRRKAQWHDDRAAAFARGRQGEVIVAEALDRLTELGYRRLDDCRAPGRPRANVDHVVIGPTGLFVIDAKNWTGDVRVRGGALRQNGYRRTRELQAAADAALDVAAAAGLPPSIVHPAICLAGSATTATAVVEGVAVLHVRDLTRWVTARPKVVSPTAVEAMYAALRRELAMNSSGSGDSGDSANITLTIDEVLSRWSIAPPMREHTPGRSTPPVAPSCAGRPQSPLELARFGRAVLCLLAALCFASALVSPADRVAGLVVGGALVGWLVALERRRPTLPTATPPRSGARRRRR